MIKQFINPPRIVYPFTTVPPLGCKLWPEIELLSALAKKTKHVAISDGWLGRPMGAVN